MTPSTIVRRARVVAHRLAPSRGARVDGVGLALDLYPWLVEPGIDTVLPLHNYFSVFFPDLQTATDAQVDVRGPDGRLLTTELVTVPHLGIRTLRLSEMIDAVPSRPAIGSVVWHLATPPEVVAAVRTTEESFFFWDRSYIGYETAMGTAFVHGVDKTELVSPNGKRRAWPSPRRVSFTARPELPVCLDEYAQLDVILQNRSRRAANMTLRIIDRRGVDNTRAIRLAPLGVVAEPVRAEDLVGLDQSAPVHLEVVGLPTRYGRPIVLKRFANGAVSLMHC